MKTLTLISLASLPLLLASCGGGSSSTNTSSGVGTLSLNLTDAPIDEANAVWVEFTGLSIKQKSEDEELTADETTTEEELDTSEWTEITFNEPLRVNLLTLQGSNHISLLSEQSLPATTYSEIRLHVSMDNELDTYIELTDGSQHELTVPSGSQTGLKVKGEITVPENGEVAFTIDFDVRKSIVVQGNGEYKLSPVLKLTEDSLTGHISGTVESELLTSSEGNWTCSDEDVDSYNAVYVFSGSGATPVDVSDGSTEPVTTALVSYDSDNTAYQFEAGYLEAGEYTVAFTCHADSEDNIAAGDDLQFIGIENVTVTAGETSNVDIVAPTPVP
ncbi:MAG: DUF4382 domain-containing protein [Pseudomonadota bacterium]|nr:DUF4382 domain-containing protein [Pseudomonadota bacterium]